MGLSGITLVLLSILELLVILLKLDKREEIMLQVSTLATSAKSYGDSSIKVHIREQYLKRPTPTLWSDIGGLCTDGMILVACELFVFRCCFCWRHNLCIFVGFVSVCHSGDPGCRVNSVGSGMLGPWYLSQIPGSRVHGQGFEIQTSNWASS